MLAFADPSYDRSLSGPGGNDVQRDNDGVAWKLATDRKYGVDTPIYLAFGALSDGSEKAGTPSGTFKNLTVPCKLALQLQGAPNTGRTKPQPVWIEACVAKDVIDKVQPRFGIKSRTAYAFTLDSLRQGGKMDAAGHVVEPGPPPPIQDDAGSRFSLGTP